MFERHGAEESLEFAVAMAAEFEDYLLDDDLYRQLVVKTAGGDRMPRMSVGSLLEILDDLAHAREASRLTPEQAMQFSSLTIEVLQLAHRHSAAYHEKLARELKSQIDSWRWFLQDCADNRSRCRNEYPFEVRIRNRIALLLDALGDRAPADQIARLQQLDQDLKNLLSPSIFILDADLEDRYPRKRYWWLYGQPAAPDC